MAPPYPIPDVDAALVAQYAEELGFESILYGEHPITPLEDDSRNAVHTEGVPCFQETIVALSRVSAMTHTIRFGFGVCLVVEHNPVRLAKQLAGIDYYSGGRLLVGIGTGWSRLEVEVMGGRFDRRWARTAEAVTLMRQLWTQERVAFDGEFNQVPPVLCFPQPAQKPGPPILLGANSDSVFQRIAAYGDGWMPALVTPELIADGPQFIRAGRDKILHLAEQAGREMTTVPITCILHGKVDRDTLKRFADSGLLERVNIMIPYFQTLAEMRERLAWMAEQYL